MDDIVDSLEALLERFKPVIGVDYDRYRNHVYRVYLNCLIKDVEATNHAKYAIAAVFHDIGIWTDHTIDYLKPSIAKARDYLESKGKTDWIEEIAAMINWHHKLTSYRGVYQNTVQNFRKADWIDVSLGLLTFGYDKKVIRVNRKRYPNLGFHLFLIKATSKNALRHPLNPLPMFRR